MKKNPYGELRHNSKCAIPDSDCKEAREPLKKRKSRPFRVLVVDDDSLVRNMLKRALDSLDVFVTVAENGLQAQQEILAGDFDLVITDINMPEMNGLDLLRWLRRQRPNIEGIVITGKEISDSIMRELQEGVTDLLFKPFSLDRLRGAVQKSMGRLVDRDQSESG